MIMGKKSTEDEFYQDIDNKKERHCCSCRAMMIVFVLLFIAGATSIWYLLKSVQSISFLPTRKVTPSQQSVDSLSDKLNQSLQQSAELQAEGQAGEVTVVITENELTSLIAQNSGDFNNNLLAIKDITALINPSAIELYGTLTRPLKSSIKITAMPSIESGHLKIDIVKVETGKLKTPDLIVNELNKTIEGIINQQVQKGSITSLSKIVLQNKQLAITGKLVQ